MSTIAPILKKQTTISRGLKLFITIKSHHMVLEIQVIASDWHKNVAGLIYNTCALSKHMGNMCMRLRNVGKGEASPSLFPLFAPNTHIYLYASTVHMYCIYPAILNRK